LDVIVEALSVTVEALSTALMHAQAEA